MEPRVAERECRALVDSPNHFAVLGIEWDASDAQAKVRQIAQQRVERKLMEAA